MNDKVKRKYKKKIKLHYKYVDSPESEKALAEVFDDIFIRLAKKYQNKAIAKVAPTEEGIEVKQKVGNGGYIIDNN